MLDLGGIELTGFAFWPGVMGCMSRICSICFFGSVASLLKVSTPNPALYLVGRHSQLCVDYPFKVFLSFLRATRTASDPPEETRMPLDTLLGSLGGFVSLRVLDFGLLVSSKFVVPFLYGLRGLAPQSLGLLLVLLIYGPDLGGRWPRAVCIEEGILVASLLCRISFCLMETLVLEKGALPSLPSNS